MTPQHEEALRALRLADRDIAVFERIKDVPEIHLSILDGVFSRAASAAAYYFVGARLSVFDSFV